MIGKVWQKSGKSVSLLWSLEPLSLVTGSLHLVPMRSGSLSSAKAECGARYLIFPGGVAGSTAFSRLLSRRWRNGPTAI